MRLKTWIAAAAAGAALAGAATTASAEIVDFTFSGNILQAYGNEAINPFGPGDPTGPYTAFFSIDTSTAGSDGSGGLTAGPDFGAPSLLAASLTIGGQTVSLGNDTSYGAVTYSGGDRLQVEAYGAGGSCTSGACEAIIGVVGVDGGFPNPLLSPITSETITASTNVGAYGAFSANNAFDQPYLIFSAPSTVSITAAEISAAPEPAAWSLMFVGVGVVGAGLRAGRRRLPAPVLG